MPSQAAEAAPAKAEAVGAELVLLVGPPGCGKSHYAQHRLSEHVRVNQDTLGTRKKCIAVARKELAAGRPCVVDATNRDIAVRTHYRAYIAKPLYPSVVVSAPPYTKA